jgi:hypothetical protein
MVRFLAALVVLGAALAPAPRAQALGTMCTEPAIVSLIEEIEAEEPPAPPSATPSPLRDEDLPWCTNADDPRCSPLNGSGSAPSVGLRQPAAIHSVTPAPDHLSEVELEFNPQLGLYPSAGEGSRVERPPRAARRAL